MKNTNEIFFKKAEREWLAPPENNFEKKHKTFRRRLLNKTAGKNK